MYALVRHPTINKYMSTINLFGRPISRIKNRNKNSDIKLI